MAEFEHLEEWIVGLHDRGILGCAAKREDFITLKSGRVSPHYANFRGIMSIDRQRFDVLPLEKQLRIRELTVQAGANAVAKLAESKTIYHLAPIPQAVTQLGGAIALRSGMSSVNVRVPEGEKGYGKHKPVEGDYQEGDAAAGFDDVVTMGDAKEEFLVPMSLAKLVVPGFVVLLDREEGGRQRIETAGYDLVAASGIYTVKDILRDNNRWSAQQYDFVEEYLDQYGDLAAA